MDPITTWGAIIALITGAGSVSAMGAWRTIGRVEGKTNRVAERLGNHSGKIDEHDRILALLPREVEKTREDFEEFKKEFRTDIKRLQTAVDRIIDDIEQEGEDHGRRTA